MQKQIYRPPAYLRDDTVRTLVLVDWSNLLYRAWFSSEDNPEIGYLRVFDMLRACVHRSKQQGVPLEMIFCGESRTPLKKLEIDPTYKNNRTNTGNDKFREFRETLEDLFVMLGWEIISVPGFEADDVIASIVDKQCHRCRCKKKCTNCDCHLKYRTDVVIFSGDKDFQQLLAWDRVLLLRGSGIFVTRESFEEEYGIPVAHYTTFLALVGDKSDNIPGVQGVGPVWATKAILCDSVRGDLEELGGGFSHAIDEYKKSYQLVQLNTKLIIDLSCINVDNADIFVFDVCEAGLNKDVQLFIERFLLEFEDKES